VAQLGAGIGTGYPGTIDTRQTFINAGPVAPDSASRLDSEVINDTLAATVAIQTVLGSNPQGTFGSLAARLQQFLPGGGESPLFFTFNATTSVTIAGTTHRLGTAAPLFQAYNAATPRQVIQPNTVSIDTLTYDATFTFLTPQTGIVSLAAPSPQYTVSFTNQTTVNIPGSTHTLGTADLLVRVYTVSGNQNILTQVPVSIAPATADVTVTFVTPASGTIIVSAAGPRFVATFTSTTTVSVPGATHGLGTAALLFAVYDNASPRQSLLPNTITVDPNTYDVVMTFVTPTSGRLIIVKATAISGTDFEIRDAGVTNASAVRMLSDEGSLFLQMGSGDNIQFLNKTGTMVAAIDTYGQISITGASAFKPGGGPWISPSDERLKADIAPFLDGLEVLLQLEPIWYRYNGQGGIPITHARHVGMRAQAVQAVAPYMVTSRRGVLTPNSEETDLLALDTQALPYVLLNALKTVYHRLETVRQEKDALAARVTALEALVMKGGHA
jgi:hypothetical protein